MSIFFIIVVSSFLVIVALQYMLIRFMLPQRLSSAASIVISSIITISINSIPFLYMRTNHIFDQLSWWHREVIVFPYAIFMVASALSGIVILIVLLARTMLSKARPRFDRSKRNFVGNAARVFAGTSFGALSYGVYHENRTPEISRLKLAYSRLHPDLCGLRIVQITDIHAGPLISFESIAKTVSMANALKPDLIILTGDYINNNPAYVGGCVRILNDLKADIGVFGVYGNHDYYTGIESVRKGFSKTGISMLSNSRHSGKGLEGLLNIIGVKDPVSGWASDARFKDFETVFRLADPNQFNLLLSHRPGIFKTCKDRKIQLTLAGHTHGGQVIIPGIGDRGFSLAGLFVTYTHGLYKSDSDPEVRMYVNRGIGAIIAPTRIFCKPEIAEITLIRG